MLDDTEDVTEPSSSTGDTTETVTPEPSADTSVPAGDRPWQNIKAEFDRKLSKVERQIAEQTQYLSAILATQRQAPPASDATRAYTDQELTTLWRQGSDEAGQELINRRVSGAVTQAQTIQAQAQTVQAQVQALYRRYPFGEVQHPLTQAALRAKQVLVSQGYNPQALTTDLEAMKLAIADNPEIVADIVKTPARVAEGVRRDSTVDVDGNRPRRQRPTGSQPAPLSEKQRDLARRMGTKDPDKVMQRFEARNASGRSAVSPMIAMMMKEDA
jgi:hypothetical protein